MPIIEPVFAAAFRRWAKTARDRSGGFHLLPFHGLDVGAVMQTGLARNPRLLHRLASQLGLAEETMRRLLVALAILHDVGKCAGTFQKQAPAIATVLGVDTAHLHDYDRRHRGHDRLGQAFLRRLAQDGALANARDGADLNELLACFTGHHGMPPEIDERLSDFSDAWTPADLQAAEALAAIALLVSGWDGTLPERARLPNVSYALAGLMTLCDWLGSSDRFAMQANPEPPDTYFARVLAGPAAAVIEEVAPAIFRPAAPPPRRTFGQLFAHLSQSGLPAPTPMQAAVEDIAAELPSGPKLLVIEDLTGSGKTEAADLFVHAMLASGEASGAYYGLPTIATAEAAYRRKRDALPGVAGPNCDLVLAHGRAFGAANWSTRAALEPGDTAPHDWFTASSKRALLAGTGVGTVDQALAGALRARLSVLRLLGLWDKVLVVDEVHACDPYMAGLLAPLLRHHAALGGSAVLLSATLPRDLHRRLADAFAQGAGFTAPPVTEPPGYPAVTLHHPSGSQARHVAPYRTQATVELRRLDEAEALSGVILDWLRNGRSVVWFRNTVSDAIDTERTMALALDVAGLLPPLLYHARFLPEHRRVETSFGKQADPAARRGRLLIATQVAEQSLDLDADELISDLAPADVLIQRLGRRRRHARGPGGGLSQDAVDRRPPSAAVIVSPDPAAVSDASWIARLLPRTGFVYDDTAKLWLTAATLFLPDGVGGVRLRGRFHAVDDARDWLDAVYPAGAFAREGDARALLPLCLQNAFDAAAGGAHQERNFAARQTLAFRKGWLRDWPGSAAEVDADGMPKTRLGDMHEVVFLVRRGTEVALIGADVAGSTCRSPRSLRTTADAVQARERLTARGYLSEHEANRLREREVILLEEKADDFWSGTFEVASGGRDGVSGRCVYSARQGLQLCK